MRQRMVLLATFGGLVAVSAAVGQPPPGPREGPADTAEETAARVMAFDTDRDGKLTRTELSDPRLQRLFDRADADKDGALTSKELTELAAREQVNDRGRGGPPGSGPPGGGGPGGPMMGAPRPGEILPAMLRRELQLTDEQSQELDALQKEVDARLAKILSAEQRDALRRMRPPPQRRAEWIPGRRPGGGPPGGGFGGPPGGPGGPPPGGFGPPDGPGRPPGGPEPPPELR